MWWAERAQLSGDVCGARSSGLTLATIPVHAAADEAAYRKHHCHSGLNMFIMLTESCLYIFIFYKIHPSSVGSGSTGLSGG